MTCGLLSRRYAQFLPAAATLLLFAAFQFEFTNEAVAQTCSGGHYLHSYAFCLDPTKPPDYIVRENSWACAPNKSACDPGRPANTAQIDKVIYLKFALSTRRRAVSESVQDLMCGPALLAAPQDLESEKAEATRYLLKFRLIDPRLTVTTIDPRLTVTTTAIEVPLAPPIRAFILGDPGSGGAYGSNAGLYCRSTITVNFAYPGLSMSCQKLEPGTCAAKEHGYESSSFVQAKFCGLDNLRRGGGGFRISPSHESNLSTCPAQPSRPFALMVK
jgi:hypothetical protein